jgi:hypothetical protein
MTRRRRSLRVALALDLVVTAISIVLWLDLLEVI